MKPLSVEKVAQQLVELPLQFLGFLRVNPNWAIQASIFILCVAYEVVNTFYELISEGATPAYALARSAGIAIKLLMVAIMIPLSRVAYTTVQNSDTGRYLGLEHRLLDHELFGTGINYFGTAHTAAHIANHYPILLKRPGITGGILLASLAVLGGVFVAHRHYKSSKPRSYLWTVIAPHRVFASVFVVASAFHTPDLRLLKYAGMTATPLLLDRMVEYAFYRYRTSICDLHIIEGTDYLSLRMKKPTAFPAFIPGQYILIKIKEINGLFDMPHPFTLVNGHGDELVLYIKKTGVWTKKLYDWVLTHPQNSLREAVVHGPFGGALIHDKTATGLTMIGTGIGMTPALAVLNGIADNIITVSNLNIHIAQRSLQELIPVIQILRRAMDRAPQVLNEVVLYLTARDQTAVILEKELAPIGARHAIQFFIPPAQPLQLAAKRLTQTSNKARLFSVPVQLNRPNVEGIVSAANTVSACGNLEMIRQVSRLSKRFGKKCVLESF